MPLLLVQVLVGPTNCSPRWKVMHCPLRPRLKRLLGVSCLIGTDLLHFLYRAVDTFDVLSDIRLKESLDKLLVGTLTVVYSNRARTPVLTLYEGQRGDEEPFPKRS